MRLNHINLTVTDVAAASAFLATYFGLHDQGSDESMGFLTDEPGWGGMIVTLMKAKASIVRYPESFHIGFFIESREDVDALAERLRADGYFSGQPKETGHSYGFYVKAPGGVLVEVGA